MTIYNIVSDVCNRKSQSLDKEIDWDDVNISPYMLQRWISMTSPTNAFLLNEYTNGLGQAATETKESIYHVMSTFAQPYRKFKYFKRKPQEKQKLNEAYQREADRLGLSQKEIRLYNKMLKGLGCSE